MVGVSRVLLDTQVNANPDDTPYGNAPSMVRMINGNLILLWSESNPTGDGSEGCVKAQILTASGARVGAEFVVNTTTAGTQALAKASVLSDGTIFIAWQDSSATGGDTSGNAIRGQLLSATGAKVGPEFLINSATIGDQAGPAVSALSNGNVLVTWNDRSQTGADTSSSAVRGQIMTAAGAHVGNEFVVNTNTTGSQAGAKVATLSDGHVVVTWTDASGAAGDTSGSSIRAQILDASGNRIGGEFQVNTNTLGNQNSVDVASLANGNFVVTWQDYSGTLGDTSGSSIKAQIFDASGHAVGGEFLVNSLVNGLQISPALARLDSGDFVITWSDVSVPGIPTSQDLRGQLFAADGSRIGLEFVVDSPTPGLIASSPGIVALTDNTFAIASANSLVDGSGNLTTLGEHIRIFAGSRELFGTAGDDQFVGARGADLFHATQGHDTYDGRGGTDTVLVDADNRSLFPVTSGTITYTLSNSLLTNSAGTLNASLTGVEQVEIHDTSAANHIFDYSGQATQLNRATVVFGDGDDRITGNGGNIDADLGLGNNVVQGRTNGFGFNALNLTVRSGTSLVTVNNTAIPPGGHFPGYTISYTTDAGSSVTTVQDIGAVYVQPAAGQGLRIDASNATAPISLDDSSYDDLLIGGRGNDTFVSFNGPGANGIDADLSGGIDYKYGNGGADTYDYSLAIPHTGGDHLMDIDSNDVLDFSYYTALFAGPNPTFIGTAAFDGTAREIRYEAIDGKTYIYTDFDGDGVTDGTVIIENGAFDLVAVDDGSGGENRLMITLEQNFVDGSSSADTLAGTTGADVIRAYQGADAIFASSGQDFVDGGAGNDVLTANLGDTNAFAAAAGARTYTIGTDRMFDTSGVLNTSFLGVESIVFSTAGTGDHDDTIDASQSVAPVTVTSGAGNDILIGGTGEDTLYAFGGDDDLSGGGGADTLAGGTGNDVYTVDSADDRVVENAGEGIDIVKAVVDYSIASQFNIELLRLSGAANINATGNTEAEKLVGNSGDNVLDGGGGGDVMRGGAGNDTYIVRDATDRIVEGDGRGDDTVKAAASYALAADSSVEHLLTIDASATAAINLTGNDYSHDIQGNAGANVLTGGSGDDVLRGFGGNDTLVGGGGADRFVFNLANAQDTVSDFVSGTDKLDLSAFGFASFSDVRASTHDVGGNAVIDLGGGNSVTLTGVLTAQLQSGDVIVSNSSQTPLPLKASVQIVIGLSDDGLGRFDHFAFDHLLPPIDYYT